MASERSVLLRRVMADPALFARFAFGSDLWAAQSAVLRSVAARPLTAVKACHASGKTFVAAAAALWWATRWPDGVVVTTAPTLSQVRRVLWGEIHKLLGRSRIAYPRASQVALELGAGRLIYGLSTNLGVNFQGLHGRVLIVIDEAVGVPGDIWEAMEGIRAGGDVRVLALGNPTVASGPFYDAFTSKRDSWACHTISAFDTPNLAGLTLERLLSGEVDLYRSDRPYLVGRWWVAEKARQWGVDSSLYRSRVLGEYPDQAADALISLAWLEAAGRRQPEDLAGVDGQEDAPLVAGIDVAGPGEDETVLAVRQGGVLLGLLGWPDADPRGRVVAALAGYGDRLRAVAVDSAGIGHYLARHLEDLGFPVVDVNVGESSSEPARFVNRKAELYWQVREWLSGGDAAGLVDDLAVGQLAGVRYGQDSRGRIAIETKQEARRRGVGSPDRAEALMLTFAAERAATGLGVLFWA